MANLFELVLNNIFMPMNVIGFDIDYFYGEAMLLTAVLFLLIIGFGFVFIYRLICSFIGR